MRNSKAIETGMILLIRGIENYLGNVHKGRPTILGHFGPTYLPMSHVFYTMPIFAEIPTYLPQNWTSLINIPFYVFSQRPINFGV